nr:phosphatidylinositol glycan, class T [Cryptococcus depauperatus CBS 7841]
MLFSSLGLLLLGTIAVAGKNTFQESLTLHPLPDGKVSVLFEFTTRFFQDSFVSAIAQSHHSLTPPSLLLPLRNNNVSELTISFVSGRWDQRRTSQLGLLQYSSGGGGGEVRGWMRNGGGNEEERWTAATHALGGLFCAGLGPKEDGENVKTFGHIYPPQRGNSTDLTHYLISHPHHGLCTENLTPFLSLLPSKGLSGLSSLLAQPGVVFSWGFKSEGIEVVMPDETGKGGKWTGWWEGVVDLIPPDAGIHPVKRDASLSKLFKKFVPRPFPEADSSVIRLILPENNILSVEPQGRTVDIWRDGKRRHVIEWDLKEREIVGQDLRILWDEDRFIYRKSTPEYQMTSNIVTARTISPPPIILHKTVTDTLASDSTFKIKMTNNENIWREAVYSEIWPWWVKGWMSEVSIELEDEGSLRPDLLKSISYYSSIPPKISTTTLHFSLSIPPQSTLILSIPFTKLTLKYNDHRPDAERGQEVPSGVLTLLDLEGESSLPASVGNDVRKSLRAHIYSPRILLDIPTPDFSMPYNVIIMSSTVMAVFFGLMQGALTRRWGWVELPVGKDKKGKKD